MRLLAVFVYLLSIHRYIRCKVLNYLLIIIIHILKGMRWHITDMDLLYSLYLVLWHFIDKR